MLFWLSCRYDKIDVHIRFSLFFPWFWLTFYNRSLWTVPKKTLWEFLQTVLPGYAYYTTVLTGAATMSLVMAGAYTASIPFKPLIYIGAILFTPWVADNVAQRMLGCHGSKTLKSVDLGVLTCIKMMALWKKSTRPEKIDGGELIFVFSCWGDASTQSLLQALPIARWARVEWDVKMVKA